jgi:hypothetical protein
MPTLMTEKSLVELGRDLARARQRLAEYREEALPECPYGGPCPCTCGRPRRDDIIEDYKHTLPDGDVVEGFVRLHFCDQCGWGGCPREPRNFTLNGVRPDANADD